MNEEMRRVFKAKRKRQKKRRKERKKEEARQARASDRERRIQQQAERLVQTRVQKGELKVVDKEGSVLRAAAERLGESTRKRANPSHAFLEEEGPSKKVVQRQTEAHVVLKEICPDQLAMKNVPLGSGSFGSCYLAAYRGIDVVVKEFRLRYYNNESKKEAETRVREELIYEARIMTKPRRPSRSSAFIWRLLRAGTLSHNYAVSWVPGRQFHDHSKCSCQETNN